MKQNLINTRVFIVALSIALLGSVATFAQVRIGLTAGAQLATIIASDPDGTEGGDDKLGLFGGLVVDAPIANNLSIRPQFLYSMKGIQDSFGGFESAVTLNYIEVPVQITYGLPVGPGKVVLGAGPYVAYALNGTSTVKFAGQTESETIEFGSDEDQLRRLDYGVRASLGYELNAGLALTAFFAPGLGTLANDSEITVRNRTFGVSLSFLFGKR